ncbi:hypothetical protein ACOSP7_023958 [Xanthoceras sorbifolium]
MVRRQLSRPMEYQLSDMGSMGFIRKVLTEKFYLKGLSERFYQNKFSEKFIIKKTFYLKSILSIEYYQKTILLEKFNQRSFIIKVLLVKYVLLAFQFSEKYII